MPTNTPMISETSICNQALTWLGQVPISSLNDQSTTAEWMKNNYPFLRDSVLHARMWTFATARAKSETQDLDPWGIQFAHPIPLDWLGVYRVYNCVSGSIQSNYIVSPGWTREGNTVLACDSIVYMYGLVRVTDTGKFGATFVQALAARIAADAAIPLTENRQLQADMWALYVQKLDEATVRDGQQGTNERIRAPYTVTNFR